MPEFFGKILAVSRDELVPNFWSSYPCLKVEVNRYKNKPYGIKQVQKGGNGRRALFAFDSLPVEIREALGDPRKVDHILEKYYKVSHEAVDFYSNFQYPDKSYLTPQAQEQYIVNASVFIALRQLKSDREATRIHMGGSLKNVMQTIHNDAITFNEFLKKKQYGGVQHNLPSNYRRFRQKWHDYDKEGFITLIKDAKGKRKHNAKKVDGDTIKLLNDLFSSQSHKPTATEVAYQYEAFIKGDLEVINNETGEQYIPNYFPNLSESTVKFYLKQWENRIGTFTKRSGNRQKLMGQFKPYHSLKAPVLSGSLISIDDRQPPFEYEKGKRMWFYNAIDLASGAFTAFVWGKTKEGLILEFYRQIVRNYTEWGINLPAGVECESSLNSSFRETFLKPGAMFQDVRIEANNARGKRIEAYYKPLRYEYEKRREGWLARPHALSESNQPGPEPKSIIPFDQLVENCLDDITAWNNTEHQKTPGKTKWEYFLENQNPNLKPTNWKAILPHIGFRTTTSCKAGIIKLQYQEFLIGENGSLALGEDLIRLMKKLEGKEFEIYWLDSNEGDVLKALVFIDGRYICEAIPKPVYSRAKIEQTEEDLKAREAMSSYVASIEKFQRIQSHSLDKLTIIDNRKKVLNDKFQIPGRKKVQTNFKEKEVENLGTMEEVKTPVTRKKPSWKDSFTL